MQTVVKVTSRNLTLCTSGELNSEQQVQVAGKICDFFFKFVLE